MSVSKSKSRGRRGTHGVGGLQVWQGRRTDISMGYWEVESKRRVIFRLVRVGVVEVTQLS